MAKRRNKGAKTMGLEIAGLLHFFGLTGFFAIVGTVFAAWMAWRIVEKAGFPGWAGLGAVLLTLTGIGSIVPLILVWVFAYMRWPRDEAALGSRPGGSRPTPAGGYVPAYQPAGYTPPTSAPKTSLPPPPMALADRRGWRLAGTLANGQSVVIAIDNSIPAYLISSAAAGKTTDLSIPDPSVGQPHARLLTAGPRLGLEDLGSPGGTFIDGARLLPEHGPRDITETRVIRFGTVELGLSRI
jgi:FHA domain